MADEPKKGDHVTWKSHGGEAEGVLERRITSDTVAGGRTVRASKDDPQYLVRSEKSGGEAVHKPSALHQQERDGHPLAGHGRRDTAD
ncbi:MAG TPA: DUF2945 domain-containing protein [Amnibacterium sp.]|jgi:hypothetical protein|uniref:DUF2945 domain-containing protein n=1 Tax=Amnibacterium sp. TaxID=1872496 RepID=UPI002F940738